MVQLTFDSTDNAITQSGTLAITGATTIDAGTADITLDEAASTFGALALTGANVAVTENAAMELAGIHDQTVHQVLTAPTTQLPIAERLAMTGATTIDAVHRDHITLDEAASVLGALALTGANVAVTENAAMELAASISGTASLTQHRQCDYR